MRLWQSIGAGQIYNHDALSPEVPRERVMDQNNKEDGLQCTEVPSEGGESVRKRICSLLLCGCLFLCAAPCVTAAPLTGVSDEGIAEAQTALLDSVSEADSSLAFQEQSDMLRQSLLANNFYYIVENGQVSVTGSTITSGMLNIPGTLGGYPVTSIADYAFFEYANINRVILPDGITHIGDSAFGNNYSLTGINFPTSLKEIGDYAFQNYFSNTFPILYMALDLSRCTQLERIGDGAFNNTYVTQIKLPNSLTYLGNQAFQGCPKLTSITFGSGLKYMGWSAFQACSSLNAVSLPAGITYGKDSSGEGFQFQFCYRLKTAALPEGMTAIPGSMFDSCLALDTVNFPSTLKTIEAAAFSGCTSLEFVQLNEGLTRIENRGFYDCNKLKEIKFPETLTYVGDWAFMHCLVLESVHIPEKLTQLGDGVFSMCSSMKSYTASSKNTAYCAVDGVLFSKDMSRLFSYPAQKPDKTYSIPTTVTELCNSSFTNVRYLEKISFSDTPLTMSECFVECDGLTEVYIPGCVSVIDGFAYCDNLSKVVFGEGVSQIAFNSFISNPQLTEVVIPGSVTEIGRYAFSDCKNLRKITFIEGQPLTVGYKAFGPEFEDSYLTSLVLPGTLVRLDGDFTSYDYGRLEELVLLPGRSGVKTMIATLPELPYTYLPDSITQFSRYSIDVPFDGTLIHTPAGSRAEKEITDYAGWDAQYYTNSLPEGIEPWRLALGLTIQDGVCSARAVNLDNKYNQGNLLVLAAYRNGKMIAADTIVPKSHTDLCSFKLSNLEGVTLKAFLLDKDLRPVIDAVVYDIYL